VIPTADAQEFSEGLQEQNYHDMGRSITAECVAVEKIARMRGPCPSKEFRGSPIF